jgi:hypothetical protein
VAELIDEALDAIETAGPAPAMVAPRCGTNALPRATRTRRVAL